MNVSKQRINGYPCVIVKKYKAQKRTHKNRFINWIYRKLYGYEEKSYLPDNVGVVFINGVYHFKDKATLKKVIEERSSISDRRKK